YATLVRSPARWRSGRPAPGWPPGSTCPGWGGPPRRSGARRSWGTPGDHQHHRDRQPLAVEKDPPAVAQMIDAPGVRLRHQQVETGIAAALPVEPQQIAEIAGGHGGGGQVPVAE